MVTWNAGNRKGIDIDYKEQRLLPEEIMKAKADGESNAVADASLAKAIDALVRLALDTKKNIREGRQHKVSRRVFFNCVQ